MKVLGMYKGYTICKAFDESKGLTAFSFCKGGEIVKTIHTTENITSVVWVFNCLVR